MECINLTYQPQESALGIYGKNPEKYWENPSVNKKSTLNYYPFGMLQPGRNFSTGEYRFGFNAQERDDEIYGIGNSYTAEFWQYDSRLGRRWNVDPVVKPHESPYTAFANNPLWFVDPKGADTSFAPGPAGDKAREDFLGTMNELDNRIESLEKDISNYRDRGRSIIGKWYFNRKADGLENKLSGLKEVRGVFDEIIETDIMFEYTTRNFLGNQAGNLATWSDGSKVLIEFEPGNRGALVHENRHGLGILLGEIGFDGDGYTFHDELLAYSHQRIYDESSVREFINWSARSQYPRSPELWNMYTLREAIEFNYKNRGGITPTWEKRSAPNSPYLNR